MKNRNAKVGGFLYLYYKKFKNDAYEEILNHIRAIRLLKAYFE